MRQYLWCTPTRRGAQCAPAALKGNCSFLGRAYLSNILIQHILQSLLGQETDAAGGFLAVFQYDQAGNAGNAVFGGKLAVFVHINAVKCGFAANFIGKLMQDHAWLKLVILAIGGLVVIRIGAGLLFPGKGGDDGAAQTPQSQTSQSQGLAQRVTSKFGGDSELLHTIVTAGVVTWCNPQAIIDGTLMLGAFSATLTVGQSTPFITGVETASALWFFGITLLVSLFSHRFSPRIVTAMNRVCGAVVVLYGVKLLADFVMAVL